MTPFLSMPNAKAISYSMVFYYNVPVNHISLLFNLTAEINDNSDNRNDDQYNVEHNS